VREDLRVRAAGVFQGVGQHGQTLRVEVAFRKDAVLVGGLGEGNDVRSLPGGRSGYRPLTQRADDVPKELGLSSIPLPVAVSRSLP
jgi:hypothetical protein